MTLIILFSREEREEKRGGGKEKDRERGGEVLGERDKGKGREEEEEAEEGDEANAGEGVEWDEDQGAVPSAWAVLLREMRFWIFLIADWQSEKMERFLLS